MIGPYLKVAIRRISRNYKSNFLIFIGLVIGLSSCFIIYTKINYEISFDRSHTQRENIYRVVRVTSGLEYTTGGLEYRTGVFTALPAEIKRSIPELQNVVTMFYVYGQKINIPARDNTPDKTFDQNDGVVFTESSFFDVFDYGKSENKWLEGEGKKVLDEPFTAVITEEISQKLFSDEYPVGRNIKIFGTNFTIRGVIQNLPENTDFPFKVLLSLPTYTEKLNPGATTDWGNLSDNFQCYVVLNNSRNIELIEKEFKEIVTPHANPDIAERRLFKLQALSKVHKESQFGNYNNRTVSGGLLLALSIIGAFIFLIACFNYSNFFLAETFKQNKQIALKLILGNKPVSVFFQFLTESLLVNFCALLLSVEITLSVIRSYYSFIDIPEGYLPVVNTGALLFVLTLLISGGIISVIFSTFNLKFKSLSSLLKRGNSENIRRGSNFGKASIILQFVVAQTVIIATLFIVKQIYFINHKELGYNSENIIYARLPENSKSKLTALSGDLLSLSSIQGVSYSSVIPAEAHNWTSFSAIINNNEKRIDAEIKYADSSYMNIYSFKMIRGYNFSASDTIGPIPIIVNKEFLLEMGLNNIDDAIGRGIRGPGGLNLYIKGVVKDFHSGSLHEEIRPCVFFANPAGFRIVNIKLAYSGSSDIKGSGIISADLDKIDKIWKSVFPGQAFPYIFLSERINNYYTSDHKALNLFLLFAFITIFLCILGILGLSLSMNERKTKEIGIRKINGATISEILAMLNIDFLKWVSFAFIFSVPIAWFSMHKWLENFAYKTELSWWVYLMGGVLTLVIALLTVSLQSWRAATRNPVEALRYE